MKTHTCYGVGTRARIASPVHLLVLCCCVAWSYAASARPLTLEDALSRALAADAALPAAQARIRGAKAGVRQADRPLNPSAGVEVENFGGSGSHGSFQRAETTLFLQQTIEMGGRRGARTNAARSELAATRARGGVRILDFLRDVELAWIEVVAATAQANLAEGRLAIAQQLLSEIARRAPTGRDPVFIQSRAEAQIALEQIAVDQAHEVARIARANLASYWRGKPDFQVDLTAFEGVVVAGGAKAINPEIVLLEAQRSLAAARVGVERSRAVPDPTVRLGVRHYNETRDGALIAGLSVPLGVFDTNQGNIDRAEAERHAAELDLASARTALNREVTRLRARLGASLTEARRIQAEVIPRADRTVQLIREGLERGGFSYVEFNDALRMLNEARLRRIAALKSFHQDNAALGRLTGRHARLIGRKGAGR